MKNLFVVLAVAVFVISLAGCSVNTKMVERERVDQEVSGNQGYLMGTPPPIGERKTTKKYIEVQVEVPSIENESRVPKKEGGPSTSVAPSCQERGTEIHSIETAPKEEYTNYKVQQGDTLQKISMKLFGTTKKWKKIFNANQDVLKTPDKLRPGMVLKIPAEGAKIKGSEYIK